MQACMGLCKRHNGAAEPLHSTCDAVRHASNLDGLTKVTFEGQTSQLCVPTQSDQISQGLCIAIYFYSKSKPDAPTS
jgi:hypothetical protein